MIKDFIIVKNDYKDTNTKPDLRMLVKLDEDEKFREACALWKKQIKKDGKAKNIYSGKLKDEFKGEKGRSHGFVLITEEEYNLLKSSETPDEEEDINPDDIPF